MSKMSQVAVIVVALAFGSAAAATLEPVKPNKAAKQYLQLLENFAGWAEQHWNEKTQSYDAQGAGVTWARGNGGVCIVYAVLLTERPKQATFSPRKIKREAMLDHVRRTLRTLCLSNKNCTDSRAIKPPTWGGPDWQAGLETEHWVFATHLLASQLDDDTKALVRQVATAEADAACKKIPSAKRGNTAADDCSWNAGVLGVVAAFYGDDPRATKWDEWAKRWALNIEARKADHNSTRIVDGKPLSEWLVSENVYADLTLENHGFWDLPYQVSFAALIEPTLAYHVAGKKIPESFHLNAMEEGDNILKWLTLADGDLLCPQGVDWAERDVQHSWAFTEIGTLLDQPWARAAERRCLDLLAHRQVKFGDGALHANDFGYETDLACMWTFSYLMHKYFGKADAATSFNEPIGAKIYPHVNVGVFRTPDLVSSITWFRARQALMVVPNNLKALGDYPSFTSYRCKLNERQNSGLGYIVLDGEKKVRDMRVDADPVIDQADGHLAISFSRTLPKVAQQSVSYCALPSGEVVVFSEWKALADINVAELADHPFYWMEIEGFLPKRIAKSRGKDVWSIDGKLHMQVLGGAGGEIASGHLIGSHREAFSAKTGEIMESSVCIYQAEVSNRKPALAKGGFDQLIFGDWTIQRAPTGRLTIKKSATQRTRR